MVNTLEDDLACVHAKWCHVADPTQKWARERNIPKGPERTCFVGIQLLRDRGAQASRRREQGRRAPQLILVEVAGALAKATPEQAGNGQTNADVRALSFSCPWTAPMPIVLPLAADNGDAVGAVGARGRGLLKRLHFGTLEPSGLLSHVV